jgi:hypothetical protein
MDLVRLDMCQGGLMMILGRYDIGQDSIKMILVIRSDQRIYYYVRNELKRNIIYLYRKLLKSSCLNLNNCEVI